MGKGDLKYISFSIHHDKNDPIRPEMYRKFLKIRHKFQPLNGYYFFLVDSFSIKLQPPMRYLHFAHLPRKLSHKNEYKLEKGYSLTEQCPQHEGDKSVLMNYIESTSSKVRGLFV